MPFKNVTTSTGVHAVNIMESIEQKSPSEMDIIREAF